MSAHTPGPWTLDGEGLGVVLDAVNHPVQTAGPDCPGDPDGSGYANARLVAAAPDLLEAANVAESFLRHSTDESLGEAGTFALQVIRAAIAKAEGHL